MRGRGIAATAAVFAIALPGAAQAATGTGADASDPSAAQLERAARGGAPPGQDSVPGAAGVNDPYFPNEGNGGYDVRTYDLALDVRGLPPGRHDAAGAADEDRRRAVLRDPPHLGGRAPSRARHHGAVHGALRAGLRADLDAFFQTWLYTPQKPTSW